MLPLLVLLAGFADPLPEPRVFLSAPRDLVLNKQRAADGDKQLAAVSVGVDLWRFETQDGRSIRKALEYLIPYATGEKKWEAEQITALRGASLAPLLRRAAVAYKEERYERLVEQLAGRDGAGTMNLLYPKAR